MRLQRKLLLVTKERDSYKGVLDSYEKEITLSGQEMDKAKVAALEKTIEEYRAMVEMLEEKGTKVNPNFEEQIKVLEEKNISLELQLEQRAIKGDFNPQDTKVLHFINNPMSQAVEKRKLEVDELTQERDALKARVHLLEEGQTTDHTMMVGKKMDDGESSQEVTQMKEQLRKAELMKQRLMEAFKKTSQSFREVVYELTGYKIDVLADQKYRLTPIYAENSGDNLLFQKASSGEVQMLETEYSLELGDLMELHLEKHNSIPMFLAGLIRQLWRRQHSNDGDEEVERALESDSGSQDSLVEGKRSKESNAA